MASRQLILCWNLQSQTVSWNPSGHVSNWEVEIHIWEAILDLQTVQVALGGGAQGPLDSQYWCFFQAASYQPTP